MRRPLALMVLVSGISFLPLTAHAQWQVDGVAICTAANNQYPDAIIPDGAGGAILTWHDGRSGDDDIYAQRVNAAGTPQWTANGVALCTAVNTQFTPTIVSDGAGGAIVAWTDGRSGTGEDIYVQRVNACGTPQWTANGVAVCTAASNQRYPTIVADGVGGAVVTWEDARSGGFDIYAQRVNASGTPQWTAGGIALCAATNNQSFPMIVSDGAAGAIVTWYDLRSGVANHIYAQRVNATGTPQWTADGLALCTAANNQYIPTIVSDGAGGAIVTWIDQRGTSQDIYAQRVNATGTPQWIANGVALCTAPLAQDHPTIASDGSGGAIVTWSDARNVNGDVYAQRVNALGAPQWTADGVALCTAAGYQEFPVIVSDGGGGAVVTWDDHRSGTNLDIYVQRVNALGVPQWMADGVTLCTTANDQERPAIASDGAGGAIVGWYDFRSGPSADLYAERVGASGNIPTPVAGPTGAPSLIVSAVHPNPFSGTASMDIELSAPSAVRIEIFDVAGRRVRAMTLSDAVSQRVEFDGRDARGRQLPSGVYFSRVTANGSTLTRKMVITR